MASRRTPSKNPSPINHGLHCSNSPSNMRRSGQVVKNANTFTRQSPDNDIYHGQRKLVSISPGVCSASLSCRIESVVSLNLEICCFLSTKLGKITWRWSRNVDRVAQQPIGSLLILTTPNHRLNGRGSHWNIYNEKRHECIAEVASRDTAMKVITKGPRQ